MASTTHGVERITYAYDGMGNRLSATTTANGVETARSDFLWDPSFGLPELVSDRAGGNGVVRYTHGLDLISTTTPDGRPFYYHHDGLGSVVAMTNASGAQQWAHSYEPYGSARTALKLDPLAPDNPMRFTGEYLDPTGLYHLRARQYDPGLGRFNAMDPAAPLLRDPYVSGYVYADSRPTTLVDPSGRVPEGTSQGIDSFSPAPRLPFSGPDPGPIYCYLGQLSAHDLPIAGLTLKMCVDRPSITHRCARTLSSVNTGGPDGRPVTLEKTHKTR